MDLTHTNDRPSTGGSASNVEHDEVSPLPSQSAMAAAAAGESFQRLQHRHQPRRSSVDEEKGAETRELQTAPTAHVAIDHFDSEGVQELRRTLTQQSALSVHRSEALLDSSVSSVRTAVGDADSEKFDFEKTMKAVVRMSEENSIKHRQLGVVFQNLTVQGLGSTASYQPTLGSLLNPLEIFKKIREVMHPPVRNILSGFEGVVNPGEMLLVLGRPGAGCTTLLKTLSNQHAEYKAVSGLLSFSSFTPEHIRKHFRGDVIYCPEDDIHFPTLTVHETLSFAARMRVPSSSARLAGHSREDFVKDATETLSTVFGLRHVKDTMVGNAAIRGVSGGERKRVSIAEALVTRALLGAWDNSTRGLDSSTALEFVRALRIATDNMGLTSIVSIYQAGEMLYEYFNKVCVIYDGRMVYYGKASEARTYFIEMGWEPANRQTTADFLVAVTNPDGRTARPGFENRTPRTADEMVAYFQRHPLAEENRTQIASFLSKNVIGADDPNYPDEQAAKEAKRQTYIESAQAERAKFTRTGSPYTISIAMQVREVMRRRVQIVRGDWLAQLVNICSYIFQAIIMGTIFLKVSDSTAAYFSRGGVLFFALLFGALTSMAEIPALYSQRPIVHRHHLSAMYHPFVESLAMTIVDVPITFVTILIFNTILYELVQLQQTAQQFFTFFLFCFTMTLAMKAFFRMIAAAFARESSAQSLAGIMTLVLVLYTGYTIPQPSMIGALRWITYINPLRYGFEAILVNEFHTLNGTCASLVPQGPGYENVSLANQVCTSVGSVPGQSTVDGNAFVELSYGYSFSDLWRNFGIVCAFALGFIVLLNVFTEMTSSSAQETGSILFKHGSKVAAIEEESADEEKGHISSPRINSDASRKETKEALEASPAMTDVFSWQHLRYTVPVGKGATRQLLDDISGYVAPGKLTALMGESGAGKTTLLNVLAGRTDTGVITGDRFVNGQGLPHDFEAQTGYCQQMDVHLPETTVREALLFSAKLRQPQSVPLAEKEAYVETCLKMCGLEAHADAIVGSLGVEHKKRTTIGVELAAKPRLLLFLDEPTSGLDSQSAWAIMLFLRSLADRGQAILCTIHQPSSELFQVFDRLLLLRKGGQTVYLGDLGVNSSTLINYFERNGARTCAPDENPAEWMLEVIGAGATATSTIDWHEAWNKSDEAAKMLVNLERMHEEGRKKPPVQATRKSEFATSWGYQVITLTMRSLSAYWRNPTYLISKLVLNIAAGLFIGFTFYQSKNTVQGTQDKLFSIYMGTVLCAPMANQLQVAFIDNRNLFEVRERPSQMYGWTSFLATQLLVEIPWNILSSSLFFLTWYWTVGFDTDRAGYTYLVLGVCFPLYYTTIAQAVAAMSPNSAISSVLFSVVFAFVISFNGVLQPFRELGWWQWMYRVSPFTYLIEGLLGQAIGLKEISCSSTELVSLSPPNGQTCSGFMQSYIAQAGGYLANPDASSACQYCSYRTSDEFLGASFNIFYDNHWRDFGIFLSFSAINIAGIFALMYIARVRKSRG